MGLDWQTPAGRARSLPSGFSGNGLLALHRNPDQLALLKANPALTTNAVEEFLRYNSSVQLTGRVALEEAGSTPLELVPITQKSSLKWLTPRCCSSVLHQPLIETDDVKWRLAGQSATTVLNCAAQADIVRAFALCRVVR